MADSADGTESLSLDLLIGADYYYCLVMGHVVRGEHGFSPVTTLIHFGYFLNGPIPISVRPSQQQSSNITIAHVLKTDETVINDNIDETFQLNKFWEYESLGVTKVNENSNSKPNLLENKITFKDKNYNVSLPFKKHHPIIPDNYSLAQTRLQSLINRFAKKPALFARYDDVIK